MSQDEIESYDRVDDHLSVKQALKAWQVRTLHDSPNSLLFVYVARILTFQVREEGSMPSQGTKYIYIIKRGDQGFKSLTEDQNNVWSDMVLRDGGPWPVVAKLRLWRYP